MTRWIEEGSPQASLWIIGEAPGFWEERHGRPFVGPSGQLLNEALAEAGLHRGDCFLTNVCHDRPPTYTDKHGKRIENDIEQFFAPQREAKAEALPEHHGRFPRPPITTGLDRLRNLLSGQVPRAVVLCGNTPLWALTGHAGITKWRGSVIDCLGSSLSPPAQQPTPGHPIRTIPTFHPADCLPQRSPWHRPILVHDLQRARRELTTPSEPPQWDHVIEPDIGGVIDWLSSLPSGAPLAADIETRFNQVACIGLASSATDAICIPFQRSTAGMHGSSYWALDQELSVLAALHRCLITHPITWHNGLFDCQYLARQWGFLPRYDDDTMVMQHVAFPGLLGGKIDPVTGRTDKKGSSLSLSFISSIYVHHHYFWKDDGRLFNPSEDDERQLWRYNCVDACRTFECRQALATVLERASLTDQYRFEMRCIPLTLEMMFRGLHVDRTAMRDQHTSVLAARRAAQQWLADVVGPDFNCESTPQMRALFYDDLAVPVRRDKHTRQPSLKDHDLDQIKRQKPLLRPLIEKIQDYRTLDTIKDDLDSQRLSADGRLRTALNPAYVETFRFSSNETAFGEGGNLQNIARSPT